jgi:hypothetical protein
MSIPSLIEADRRHLIHPVVSYRAHEARGVTVLESAQGVSSTATICSTPSPASGV